jgi:hypothetical protein
MAPEQQRITEAAQDNVSAAFGGVVLASQNFQAIASEFAQMSLESVENATQVVDRFSKAKSWDQIFDIQNNYLKISFDTFAQHSTKVAELMTTWPSEMGKTYRRVSRNLAEAGGAAAKTAASESGATAEKAMSAGERASGAPRPYSAG